MVHIHYFQFVSVNECFAQALDIWDHANFSYLELPQLNHHYCMLTKACLTLLMLVAKCCYEENFTHFTCLPWLFILFFKSFPFFRNISCGTCMRLRGPRKSVTALLFSPRYPFILSSPSILSSFPPFQSPFSSSFFHFPSLSVLFFPSFFLVTTIISITFFLLFQIVFDYSVVIIDEFRIRHLKQKETESAKEKIINI